MRYMRKSICCQATSALVRMASVGMEDPFRWEVLVDLDELKGAPEYWECGECYERVAERMA